MKRKLYIISSIIFLVDQISKILVVKLLNRNLVLIPNFFSLTYTKNTGGAFSFLRGNVFLLSLVGILFLFVILLYIHKNPPKNTMEMVFLASILGGLTGNLVDRIFRCGVIDFLNFTIFQYHYPIFNIADIAIVLGIVGVILLEMREGRHEGK